MTTPITAQATIQRLRIQNYRVLRDVQFSDLTPLTVLLGPNGSGKSTVFDVFAFLHEAFTTNLRAAWDRRNRIGELRSRGESGPITIEIAYRRAPEERLVTYRLELDEENGSPPNVVQYLSEQHPNRLADILRVLADRVPQLERVDTELLADGRLLLRFKDAPFEEPVLAKYASDGTLKLLAYLTVLYDPAPPSIVGIEEPENFLHPRLLQVLAEEVRGAAGRSQLLVTTHSPYFVDPLRPKELWVLYRDNESFSRIIRASDMRRVVAQVAAGGLLGNLWMEGYFEAGDPLVRGGRPKTWASA